MSYCYEKGIPHSEFLEWEADDRQKVMAFLLEQAESCSLCGTAKWEWDEDPYAYIPMDNFCKGCYIRNEASKDEKLPGTTVELVRSSPELLWELQRRAEMQAERAERLRKDEE